MRFTNGDKVHFKLGVRAALEPGRDRRNLEGKVIATYDPPADSHRLDVLFGKDDLLIGIPSYFFKLINKNAKKADVVQLSVAAQPTRPAS